MDDQDEVQQSPPPRRSIGLKSLDRGNSYEYDGRELIPRPDPTALTTQLVDRAVLSLKEDLAVRFAGMAEATKLVRDQHAKLVADVPLQLHTALIAQREFLMSEMNVIKTLITSLDQVSKERFIGIAVQFDERDKRTEQLSQATKEATNALSLASATAIAAALQAQKESAGAQNDSNAAAVAKSEAAFTKQIDQITVLITAIQKGNDDKTNDLKNTIGGLAARLDRGEGGLSGAERNRIIERESRVDQTGSNSNVIAIIAASIGALALLGVMFNFLHAAMPQLSH